MGQKKATDASSILLLEIKRDKANRKFKKKMRRGRKGEKKFSPPVS